MTVATTTLTRHDEFDAAAADKAKLVVMRVSKNAKLGGFDCSKTKSKKHRTKNFRTRKILVLHLVRGLNRGGHV